MSDRPNIILLVMDSARASNMSCYGYERPTTPNLDRLAQEGTLYEQAISLGCWTLPVHVSLFTGLYPLTHGVTISKNALPDGFPLLAGRLNDLGYETACFSNNAYVSDITNLTQQFHVVDDVWRTTNPRGIKRSKMWRLRKRLEQYGPAAKPIIAVARQLQRARAFLKRQKPSKDKGARLTNQKIASWLRESRDAGKPFFLFLNYMEPHEPYNPPHPYHRRFMPKRFSSRRVAQVGNNKDVIERRSETRRYKDDLEIIRALYDGELSYLDYRIGQLTDLLKSLNILDDTVLIVTSDHGESLGEHEHIGHRMTLYEPLIHVPLIIRYPARFSAGRRVKQLVSLIDLYPTMLELAGAGPDTTKLNDVYSLLDIDTLEKERPYVIAENTAPKSMDSVVSRVVRTQRYKYIWKSDGEHELYDLREDGRETVNLIDRCPDVARELQEQLAAWMDAVGAERVATGEAYYESEIQEHLQKLGYVD